MHVTYSPGINGYLDVLTLNGWVFPKDSSCICYRSSGPNDYVAEWHQNNDKYELKWKAYHEYNVNVREKGTLIETVNTIHEILAYCCTHFHPDL